MEQKGQTGEIVMYQPDETIRLEVRMDNETANGGVVSDRQDFYCPPR